LQVQRERKQQLFAQPARQQYLSSQVVVYPFDTQRCAATFIMKGNSGKFIQMVADELRYLGPIDLTQYYVEEYTIRETTIPPNVGAVTVELTFGRRILSTILTTYLPTLYALLSHTYIALIPRSSLICLVSFATNYFKGYFFEAIVTVNLTSLLVLTTLFISVSNSLPETSDLKMMDVWLIVCLFIPFAEVLLQTFIEAQRLNVNSVNHHGTPRHVERDVVGGGVRPGMVRRVRVGPQTPVIDPEEEEKKVHAKEKTIGKLFKAMWGKKKGKKDDDDLVIDNDVAHAVAR